MPTNFKGCRPDFKGRSKDCLNCVHLLLTLSTSAINFNVLFYIYFSARCLLTPSGVGYTGTLTRTVSNRTCQRWDTNTPHVTTTTYLAKLTADGRNPENYCRNVGDWHTLWCYTTDPGKRWENCFVPLCSQC